MWHARLGHLNGRDLSTLSKDGNANGLKIKTTIKEIKCESCISGNMSSIPFGTRENFSTELLELVYTDFITYNLIILSRINSDGRSRRFSLIMKESSSTRKWRIYSGPQVSDSVLRHLIRRNRTAWPSKATAPWSRRRAVCRLMRICLHRSGQRLSTRRIKRQLHGNDRYRSASQRRTEEWGQGRMVRSHLRRNKVLGSKRYLRDSRQTEGLRCDLLSHLPVQQI